MKYSKILLALWPFLFCSTSFGNCNLKLTKAAGQYLSALEEASLTRYQNNSVCEVLNYEIGNCTKEQRSKLKSVFDLSKVLGSFCQPHLPPPKHAISKDHFIKGADLYSWQDQGGYLWYALLPGFNRTKTTKDFTERKASIGQLKQELKDLPPGTPINWNNLDAVEENSSLEFVLPSEHNLRDIIRAAELLKLKMNVIK